jgi:HSP90 family molecular chaperone
MAELHITQEERTGIMKEIDEGAYDLVFQAIQEDIYSFPIRSFVREAISNGLDSITEREIAKAIKAGANKDDYYLQRQDGKLLKDSEFNPEYYDVNYLSNESTVIVRYTDGTPRDTISIVDDGVGLGGERLKGFFKIG